MSEGGSLRSGAVIQLGVIPVEPSDSVFDAEFGDEAMWSRKDRPHIEDLMVRVRASSTMPGLMPRVHLDGQVYVDGAMGEDGGIALSQAQREGFEKFVIVLTQERSYRKVPQRFPAIYRSIFRRCPAVGEALLSRWKRYNETRDRIFALEEEGKAHVFAPERMSVDMAPGISRVLPRLIVWGSRRHVVSCQRCASSSECNIWLSRPRGEQPTARENGQRADED